MKFIVFHLSQSPEGMTDAEVLREEVGLMSYADELGFDAVWMAEHHFHHYCVCPEPLLLAAHAAASTRRIRIGTAANVLSLGQPMRIAEQAAMVDCLSGGRLDVGFAKGYGPREFAAYGVELAEAGERFREAVEIILGAWTQDEFTYQGKHFQVPYPVTLRPRPVQQPHPPTFVATSGNAETLQFAAERGLSFYVAYENRSRFQKLKEDYTRYSEEAGRTPEQIAAAVAGIAVMQTSYLAPTNEESFDEARPGVDWMAKASRSVNTPEDLDQWPEARQSPVRARLDTRAMGLEHYDKYWKAFIYGDPERGIERVQRLKDSGVENVIVGFSFGGLPYDKVRRSMRLFAEKVMPRFK